MNIFDLFLRKTTCAHTHALINTNEGYCPDCGKFVKKYFYIVRCSCCEVKREAKVYFGEVLPKDKFCTNCGSKEYYVQKLDTISFVDIDYAVHTKEVFELDRADYASTQVWVENENVPQVRFLTSGT